MRKFVSEGHKVYIVCPLERKYKKDAELKKEVGAEILYVRTLNLQKTGLIEKGVGTLLLETQFLRSIKKHYKNIKFDLVLYSTPPITFSRIIRFIKNRDGARSYLLLKDIFPQNAIDMGFFGKNSFFARYFRKREIDLYNLSDKIGCMSPANISYVKSHNPYLDFSKLEENPNSIEVLPYSGLGESKAVLRRKYNLPESALICIYGGNLGKPQGIGFLLDVVKANANNQNIFFLIIGSGTEFNKVESFSKELNSNNLRLMSSLPVDEYSQIVACCDLGLIFLHADFTIPNFPSRLLAYLEKKLPVLAATDENSDIGVIIEDAGCGYWVKSGDLEGFNTLITRIITNKDKLPQMGENGYQLLSERYSVDVSYRMIAKELPVK